MEAGEDSLNYLVRLSLTIAKLEKGRNWSADKGAGLQAWRLEFELQPRGTHVLKGGDPLFSIFHARLWHTRSKTEECEGEEEGPTHPYLQLPSSPGSQLQASSTKVQ